MTETNTYIVQFRGPYMWHRAGCLTFASVEEALAWVGRYMPVGFATRIEIG
jgi:hypothetical protein